ncbi:3'-phosphoadenosine 5'-phosphosulfate sulfotransferase (PAPS reductase)/FAD synthetase [Gluconacetobacter diazotrophicus]|nr:3'-phosphoadenosine 5'-phosphosulfate sulfotransferase (PAPS reductase)/FAD synthetase [Gluconacetobacter diazotrophicus]
MNALSPPGIIWTQADNDGRPVPSYGQAEAIAVVSISGGKDSLATALVAIERYGAERVRLVHADTGNEHPLTEQYVRDYLPGALGLPVSIVRADFAADIERKRRVVLTKWVAEGVPDDVIQTALAALVPTGNPFLDLCVWKGRFPSRRAQFCTTELKVSPLGEFMLSLRDLYRGLPLESWQGVRRDESVARADALMWEIGDGGWWIHRPIIHWTAQDTFAIAARYGIEPNPLYRMGMRRVGCMPCINCGKGEIAEIARRWPDVVERIRAWEAATSRASKRTHSTFFHFDEMAGRTDAEHAAANSIDQAVAWSRTSRGGRQFDLEAFAPAAECSSVYGHCE